MAFRTLGLTRRGGGSNKVTVKPNGQTSTAIVIGKALLAEIGWEQGDRVNVMIGEGDDQGRIMVQRDEEGLRKITTTASAMITMPRGTIGFLDPELKFEPVHEYDEDEDALLLDFEDAEGAEVARRNTSEEKEEKPTKSTKRSKRTTKRGKK